MKPHSLLWTKKIVLCGLLAASLTGGKLALMGVPNVEIVTLLIISYTVVFGGRIAFPVTLVFVSVEMLLFGLNTWGVSYYIHWCGMVLITAVLRYFFKENPFVYIAEAVIMTAMFGVLTTLVDTLFLRGEGTPFFKFFSVMYLRGVNFYIVHVVSNAVIVSASFLPLTKLLHKLKRSYLGISDKIV